MFERFTDSARRVIVTAQEEARHLLHPHIGCEHLLLGLFRVRAETENPALIRGLPDLDIAEARDMVAELVGTGTAGSSFGHMPFTPNAKKVMELSLREALRLRHGTITPGHLLLAVLSVDDPAAMSLLANLSVDADVVRAALVEFPPPGSPGPGPLPKGRIFARLDTLERQVGDILEQLRELRARLDDDGTHRDTDTEDSGS